MPFFLILNSLILRIKFLSFKNSELSSKKVPVAHDASQHKHVRSLDQGIMSLPIFLDLWILCILLWGLRVSNLHKMSFWLSCNRINDANSLWNFKRNSNQNSSFDEWSTVTNTSNQLHPCRRNASKRFHIPGHKFGDTHRTERRESLTSLAIMSASLMRSSRGVSVWML